MPQQQRNHSLVRFRGFPSGLVTDISEILLNQQVTPDCLNVDFGEGGEISKRKGFTKWSTSDPAGMNYGTDLYHYRESDGTDWLIYVDLDRDIWTVEVGAGTTLGSTTADANSANSAVAFDNVFYISGHGNSENTWSFNGTSWSEITDSTLDGDGSEFPLARNLVNKHDRVFAMNLIAGGTTHGSRIWFSQPGDANDWEATSWIDVDPDDGTSIVDITPFGERIIIFKDHSFFLLSGVDALSFTLFPVDPMTGTIARRTARVVDGIVLWFDPNSGVWAFDGATFRQVDTAVNSHIMDNVDTPSDATVAYSAFVRDGKYYLGVPWSGGTDNYPSRTFVFDVRANRWTEYDYAFSSVVRIDQTFYGVGLSSGSTPTKGIWKLFDGDDDAGTNISAYFETTWFAPGDGFIQQHRLRKMQMYLDGTTSNPATMTVETYIDWGTSASNSTTQSANTSNDMSVFELSGFDEEAKAWKVRVSNDSDDAWTVNGLDILFSSRTLSRGDLDG